MDAGDIDPVSIFLVKKGGGGDRLLFRYPYSVPQRKNKPIASGTSNLQQQQQQQRNPYALTPQMLAREVSPSAKSNKTQDTLKAETLPAFSSKVLSNLFAAHPGLCGEKFELKISEVRFIGHPMSLEIDPQEARYFANKSKSPLTMFHVVFALRATAPYSVVECYHDLSQQIGAAIRNEERRVGYLTAEAKTMANAQDEVASMPEDKRVSPFELAQDRAQLAQDLKEIYESMRYSGSVYRRINKYIEVNFCIPQKVFHKLNPCLNVDPEAIFDCLEFLKPYHTFLLLYEPKDLLNQLPLDGSPPLYKLVRSADPTMSFRALASDTMIPLRHTFELAGHLLYWGKATVIYPVCENNVYIISPKIGDVLTPVVMERFADKFPGENFVSMLSMFNNPTSISHRQHFHNPGFVQLLGRIIVFFLQQHLIVQIHTYVTLKVNPECSMTPEDPVRKKYGLPWSVARHLGDVSAVKGTGGDKHIVEACFNPEKAKEQPQDVEGPEDLLKQFKEDERKVIVQAAIPTATLDDFKTFAKVAPYFNGRYHIEEILYFANLRRSDLIKVMDVFIDVLVFHEHEDPAVTSYYDMSLRSNSQK